MLQPYILKTINVYRVLEKDSQNYYKKLLGLSESSSIMEIEQALEKMYRNNKDKAVDIAKEMGDELLDKK